MKKRSERNKEKKDQNNKTLIIRLHRFVSEKKSKIKPIRLYRRIDIQ